MHSINISTSRKFSSLANFLEKIYLQLDWFRIKNHLRIVEQELLNKDISHLSEDLKIERSKNIERLHEYWTRGVYPKNIDFTNKFVPYFRDHFGTLCAMAYLIDASGHQEIVEEVAKADNHVYIKDIKDGPVLEWIRKSGLTQKEAARIQPTYGGYPIMAPGGYESPFFELIPWVFFVGILIILEIASYRISTWFSASKRGKRIIALLYFTATNTVVAFVLAFLIFELFA